MLLIVTIVLIGTVVTVFPIAQGRLPIGATIQPQNQYILVGGQNGTWFENGQSPRLYKILLSDYSVTRLTPVRSGGTVWGGGFSGSQLLVSGWGSDDASFGPYIWLYNGASVVTEGSLDAYGQASSWSGGDIFAASYNGKEWLLSGLGSGPLGTDLENHMSLGTFNGNVFTDLSSLVPRQDDAILYANAWNGHYWLVGGGYTRNGVLFTFNGSAIVDLTGQAESAISNFASVQSIAWNGRYWLIGGIGFLASFDGQNFVDLTSGLSSLLGPGFTVNAMAWGGDEWMLAGGSPVAQLLPSKAWVVSYSRFGFVNLSRSLPAYLTDTNQSSILTIAFAYPSWMFGGYSGSHGGMLLSYQDESFKDLSYLVKDMSYVIWIWAGVLNSSQHWFPPFAFASSTATDQCIVSSSVNRNPRHLW